MKIDVETVWLTQRQLAKLFATSTDNIGLHLRNIYASKELMLKATTEEYSVVQTEGGRQVERRVKHYNLDAIISVGYRVNSKRGIHFRIWATKTLRDHLLNGFTLNRKRLEQRGSAELQATVDLLAGALIQNKLVTDEGEAVLDVITRYARSWHLLLAYDEDQLPTAPASATKSKKALKLPTARTAIAALKATLVASGQATPLFGLEREDGLDRILAAIEQTFGGKNLYATAEARASHLLYFVIKDHPFTDGNKRIASFLFLEYLRRNGLLHRPSGQLLIDDRALVAIALLIAESNPAHKDLLIRLVTNFLASPAA